MTGLTSVTFRGLSAEEIVGLAKQAELDGIEWGTDLHVRPGDLSEARRVRQLTENAGLRVLSYGSYHCLCKSAQPEAEFRPVLEAAATLHAPMVRIWAGELASNQAGDGYFQNAAEEFRLLCGMAAAYGIQIGTECHRDSLTDTAGGTLRLLRQCGWPGASTYWQPNPDSGFEENLAYLRLVKERTSYLHVFHWENNEKQPLAQGEPFWAEYLSALKPHPERNALILEFVKDDSPEQFLADAAVLTRLANERRV